MDVFPQVGTANSRTALTSLLFSRAQRASRFGGTATRSLSGAALSYGCDDRRIIETIRATAAVESPNAGQVGR